MLFFEFFLLIQLEVYPLIFTFQIICLIEKVTSKTLLRIFLCSPIFVDGVLDNMIFRINTDTMFILDDVSI